MSLAAFLDYAAAHPKFVVGCRVQVVGREVEALIKSGYKVGQRSLIGATRPIGTPFAEVLDAAAAEALAFWRLFEGPGFRVNPSAD